VQRIFIQIYVFICLAIAVIVHTVTVVIKRIGPAYGIRIIGGCVSLRVPPSVYAISRFATIVRVA
jgi:hypothetical protein